MLKTMCTRLLSANALIWEIESIWLVKIKNKSLL